MFDLVPLLLAPTAGFSWFNQRYLRLPPLSAAKEFADAGLEEDPVVPVAAALALIAFGQFVVVELGAAGWFSTH